MKFLLIKIKFIKIPLKPPIFLIKLISYLPMIIQIININFKTVKIKCNEIFKNKLHPHNLFYKIELLQNDHLIKVK